MALGAHADRIVASPRRVLKPWPAETLGEVAPAGVEVAPDRVDPSLAMAQRPAEVCSPDNRPPWREFG